jgi:hypothetical protein
MILFSESISSTHGQWDTEFHEHLPRLFPQADMRSYFVGSKPEGEVIVHLQGGWFNFGSAKAHRHLVGHIAERERLSRTIGLLPNIHFRLPRATCWHVTKDLPRGTFTGLLLPETPLEAIWHSYSRRALPAKPPLSTRLLSELGDEVLLRKIRGLWPGVLVLNRRGADLPTRIADIDDGTADVIAVASMSLANPDLVERIKTNAPLKRPRPFDVLWRRDKRLHGLPKPCDDGTSIRSRGNQKEPSFA